MVTLRWYQAEAKAALYRHLEEKPEINPCAVLPTASGKTPLLAAICDDVVRAGRRALVLAHVKELLEQSADKLQQFLPADKVGIYSAGLNSRDTKEPVIVAGIQSVYQRAGELGAFAVIIVDEAHLINSKNDSGMYKTFLTHAKIVNPNVRIVGLTATPYRLDSGYICGPENVLNEITYEVGIKELIVQGYLCPIKTRAGKEHPNLSGIQIRGGEFNESEMAERMDDIVATACAEVAELTKDRKSVLIFAASVEHGRHVQEFIAAATGEEVGFVYADTPAAERATLLARFKGDAANRLFTGRLKYLVNVNVLTTGFDAPNVDSVVLLRATLSPGLYYQMVGRGLRLHPDKTECVVLDYGENAVRHGPIDAMKVKDKKKKGDGEAPAKECPECSAVVFAGVARCPECGFEFPKPEANHNEHAGAAGVLSGEVITREYEVKSIGFFVHNSKRNPDGPTTMRVDYTVEWGRNGIRSEWLCFNHENFARQRAESWWRERSLVPPPATTEDAVKMARIGVLRQTSHITWREVSGEKYGRVIGWKFKTEPPPWEEIDAALTKSNDESAMFDDIQKPELVSTASKDWFDATDDDIPF